MLAVQDIQPLLGHIKTFGHLGPKYQICGILEPIAPNDWKLKITLVETGEETEYPYSKALQDPEAD